MDEKRFEQLETNVALIKKEVSKIRRSIRWDLSISLGLCVGILAGIAYMMYDVWEGWDSVSRFLEEFRNKFK